jgi:hypothetical protein
LGVGIWILSCIMLVVQTWLKKMDKGYCKVWLSGRRILSLKMFGVCFLNESCDSQHTPSWQ